MCSLTLLTISPTSPKFVPYLLRFHPPPLRLTSLVPLPSQFSGTHVALTLFLSFLLQPNNPPHYQLRNLIESLPLSALTLKLTLSLSPHLAPTALLLFSQPPDYKPENRPHYPGGWGSGVGSLGQVATTLAVSRRRGRSGPGISGTCEIPPAFAPASEGASPRAQFDSHPGRHPPRHSRRHPAWQARPRGPRCSDEVQSAATDPARGDWRGRRRSPAAASCRRDRRTDASIDVVRA